MHRLNDLNEDHRKTLTFWMKALKCYGVDISNGRPSWLKVIWFPTLAVLFGGYASRPAIPLLQSKELFYLILAINTLIPPVQIIVNYVLIQVQGNKIERIIFLIDELWPRHGDHALAHRMLSRQLDIFYKGIFYMSSIGLFMLSLVKLVVNIIYMIRKETPLVFDDFFRTTAPFIALWMTTATTTVRCLLGTIVKNASVLLLSLQIELEDVVDVQTPEAEVERKVKELVQYHQKILTVTDKLRDVFSISSYPGVFAASYLLGFHGHLAYYTVVSGHLSYFTGSFVSVLLRFGWMLTLYWSGQILADSSEGVANAAYSCLWYTSNQRIRSSISIIMIRSQRPIYMTATKFIRSAMTLASLGVVLSDAWSFASFMTSTYSGWIF